MIRIGASAGVGAVSPPGGAMSCDAEHLAGEDPRARARALAETFDAVLAQGTARRAPRPVVSASWARSLAAHVDPERRTPPVVHAADELDDLRAAHPMNAVMPLLRSALVGIADDAMHLVLVTDAAGHVLWRDGDRQLLGQADRVGLFPGTDWSEAAIGTNAMGTALAVGAPVQIHSAEHLVRTYHSWTCVAAPVHDPDTGAIIGVLDVSGPLHAVNPALAQLVAATARLAEDQLRVRLAIADERRRLRHVLPLSRSGAETAFVTPSGRVLAAEPTDRWPAHVELGDGDRVALPDGREAHVDRFEDGCLLRTAVHRTRSAPRPVEHVLSLRCTGTGTPTVTVDDRAIPLPLRLAELLLTLTRHPDGLTGEQLAQLLYGDRGNQTTVRGEIRRLRTLVGADLLQTRPYRLVAQVGTDVDTAGRALAVRHVRAALSACRGPVLPRSEAPEIRQLSDELTAGLRRAVLATDDPELLYTFSTHPLGEHDGAVHDRLAELLSPADPRSAAVAVRRARLLSD
ncbi:GAF domain-containing protein [Modestobacter sp. VKM Ac-2985]|uniref:GAF domain-containing protein n=1 Tax=Modestobacter sp. VKM Ac-2985 TaxID=3004139 RepID=UPI0022ABBE9F|nr:GAF domain-containing protein [Modestobacter sp. VKM Ac-2985]MCZ2835911.1 GAF domain-containing protein [Modestobacter sp. VKM Ac-2985]